jgi:hypothetical protein
MANGALLAFGLNILSALVALLTSYYAYRANRLVGNPVLRAMNLGFMLLGIGLVVDAGTSILVGKTLVESFADRVLVLSTSFTYLTIQMAAYVIIAVGYAKATFGGQAKALAPVAAVVGPAFVGLRGYSLLSYFVVLVLLLFVVFQGFLLRSGGAHKFSASVLLGFGLILVAHVVLLVSVATLGTGLFLIGTGIQFLGFLSLLVFVVRSEMLGPG